MKKTAITILKIAVSIGLYLYIFKKIDLSKLWEHLRGAEVSYFIAAIAVYFLIQGLSAWRWYLLLRPLDIRAPYSRLLQYYLLGMLFNNFMPTGIGGDVFRIYYLHKDTGKLSRATASVFFDRNLGMAALLLMATVSALIAGTKVQGVLLAPLFILIGVELLETLKAYLRSHVVRVELVVEVALIALARKIIVLDPTVAAFDLLAIAALVVALAAALFAARRGRGAGPKDLPVAP